MVQKHASEVTLVHLSAVNSTIFVNILLSDNEVDCFRVSQSLYCFVMNIFIFIRQECLKEHKCSSVKAGPHIKSVTDRQMDK